MAKPNKIYKYSRRSMILEIENVFNTISEAERFKDELKAKGIYNRVSLNSFRIGSRKERIYNYVVRAYKKPPID